MRNTYERPKEGDLYMRICLYGHTFELRYGYYEDTDRARGEPVVIYPDLRNDPIYTADGNPLVTAVQIPCEHYEVAQGDIPEECCSDCMYYKDSKNEIEICLCEERQKHENRNFIPVGGDEE